MYLQGKRNNVSHVQPCLAPSPDTAERRGARELSCCGSVLHSYGHRGGRAEPGDICCVSVPQLPVYQSACRHLSMFCNVYSKLLQEA